MPPRRGFTYVWLLLLLAATAAGLAALAQPMRLTVQREREAEFRFRGEEIARGLSSYWAATPGEDKQLPLALKDLLDDRRGPRPLHHLRRLYDDPFTGAPDWVPVLTEDGRISGVHSRAEVPALRVVDVTASASGGPVLISMRVFSFRPPSVSAAASAASDAAAASSPADPGSSIQDNENSPFRSFAAQSR